MNQKLEKLVQEMDAYGQLEHDVLLKLAWDQPTSVGVEIEYQKIDGKPKTQFRLYDLGLFQGVFEMVGVFSDGKPDVMISANPAAVLAVVLAL